MNTPTKWLLLLVFQLVFGFSVFLLTRSYYAPSGAVADSVAVNSSFPIWPGSATESPDLSAFDLLGGAQLASTDPGEIARQADAAFTAKQYDAAARLYERLLEFDPRNSDTLNNLGITLHYLGRSTEAISRLNEGLAEAPSHQRLWLTLGFVNSQLGNTEQARVALTNAQQAGTDEEITRSAQEMLRNLP